MKGSQSRQNIYHDKRRMSLVTGVKCVLKCRKLTPHFVGPFEIIEKVGAAAYQIALPSSLSNFHDVFHVSQLR